MISQFFFLQATASYTMITFYFSCVVGTSVGSSVGTGDGSGDGSGDGGVVGTAAGFHFGSQLLVALLELSHARL